MSVLDITDDTAIMDLTNSGVLDLTDGSALDITNDPGVLDIGNPEG